MKFDFSIVTPSFNQAQFVGYTLKSVYNQKNVKVQHIVVDPGSTDGSREIISEFEHVTLIDKKDSCQSEGINNGFKECTGDFIAWLNSDDIYPDSSILKKVKKCFDDNPSVDVVYGNAIFVDDNGDFLRKYYVNGVTDTLSETFEYQVGICQPAVFWRRKVYEELGGLDESLDYQLDYEYWIRFSQANLKWKHLNSVLAAHRWWSGMKTSSKRDLSLSESLNLVKKKFGYVHVKWAERLAELEVNNNDGIISLGQSGNDVVKRRTLEILKCVNTDSKTLELLQSKNANSAMNETLMRMSDSGIDIQPHYYDAKMMNWENIFPRFLYPDDHDHPSLARRPEIRVEKSTGIDYLIYCAEPNYSVAQDLEGYKSNQHKLANYLKYCKPSKENTCVIAANGPSLSHSLSDELFSFDLIISNFAYKHEKLLQHAKYFTIVNHTVANQVYADWMKLDGVKKFFPFWLGRHVPSLEDTYFVNSTVIPEFSANALRYISWRSTVSYFNIQLAYSLGYRRIILVGFDNSYIQPESVCEGDELDQKSDDPNHFLPNYFKGKTWQAADTDNMNHSYCEALEFAMNNDVEIINCTVGGHLHVFPRRDISDFISSDVGSKEDDNLKLLNPGEISALSKFPYLMDMYCKNGSIDYSILPDEARKYLLSYARKTESDIVFSLYESLN